MRLPFVSRFAYDELAASCASQREVFESVLLRSGEMRDAERAEVKRLTDLLFDMKRDGFNAPVTVPQAPPPEPLPEPIREALAYLAREGYTGDELAQEEAQARRLLKQGLEAAQVAAMLVQGDPSVAR